MNLLDQLQPSKHCIICGETKPLSAFAIGSTATGKAIYSQICDSCRSRQAEEEEKESGGKKARLNLDSNRRQSILDRQADDQETFHNEKEDYIDELDKDSRDKADEKKTKEKEKRRKGFLNDFLNREEKWLKTHIKSETTWAERQRQLPSTEFGFDADVHDPLRQRPNAAHHFLYVTHPDRMDVKFLLEYILSGDYAQRYTGLIGPSTRGFLHQPGQTPSSGELAGQKFFRLSEVRFSHPGRLDIAKIKNAKGSMHVKVDRQAVKQSAARGHYTSTPDSSTSTTPTQLKSQGKTVATRLATNLHPATAIAAVPMARTTTVTTPAAAATTTKTTATTSRMAFLSNARTAMQGARKQSHTRSATSQGQFRNNPSSFVTAGVRATQLHNQSKPIGCEFVKSSRHSAGTFQRGTPQKASESAKKAAGNVLNSFKSSWGGGKR